MARVSTFRNLTRRHPLLRWREESELEVPAEMPRAYWDWLTLESDRIN